MLSAGQRCVTATFLYGLFVITGCQTQVPVPVEGIVKLNNKPLADATVLFSPARASDPGPFIGTTDNEGRFSLTSPDKKVTGAAPGNYMVMITMVRFDPNAPDGPPLRKESVPVAFTNGSQRFEVPPGGTKDANFDIKGTRSS
jgi:hypothetical protein